MQQEKIFSKTEFLNYYKPLLKGYSKSFENKIPSQEFISWILFSEWNEITISQLIEISETQWGHWNYFIESLLIRLIGVREIIHSRDNNLILDIDLVWSFVSKSIKLIPSIYTISSIWSQWFLSIPLYKFDVTLETFDFIRLHIWDDSLNEYIDLKKRDDFSIHSHTFFVKSWILTGKVINNRFTYKENLKDAQYSFFKVEYNDSINEVNQHTSMAVNQNVYVRLERGAEEVHVQGWYYEIKASDLHRSGHKNSPWCSATFFSFTGKDGLGESFVLGPKEINSSEINRKKNISPFNLLDKINNQLWIKQS